MTYKIVVLDYKEEFIRFLDTNRCEVKETIKTGGLRTLEIEYRFENLIQDKELFKLGNKIWVSGDININDCLYVINTKVEEDIFKDNCFKVEIEEVLVELNNAPPVFQLELETWGGFNNRTGTDPWITKVDYNFLNYMFGDYFNIGVVQDCLSNINSWFSFTGSVNRMDLLRRIEEDTGNVFVTRYEKDELNNDIHRYLDFLNPINANKNWTLNLEYDFQNATTLYPAYDDQGNPCQPDFNWEVSRYTFTTPADIPDVWEEGQTDWYVKGDSDPNWTYNAKDETVVDENIVTDYTPITDLNPEHCSIQITNPNGNLLNSEGEPYNPNDPSQRPLKWLADDIGFDSNTNKAVITLCMIKRDVGMTVNSKTFPLITDVGGPEKGYVAYTITEEIPGYTESIASQILEDNMIADCSLPDDSYIEIFNDHADKVLFRTCINRQIGHVHEEILDFNYNISNVELETDESNTYTAVTPIMNQRKEGTNDPLIGHELNDLIVQWKNLSINKGDIIPMIISRIYVTSDTLEHAEETFGVPINTPTDYWGLVFHPEHQIDTTTPASSKWNFWRGSAYWQAPFTKKAGEMFIASDKIETIQYGKVAGRTDTRNEKGPVLTPKMGTSSTTAQVPYMIYNEMALYLKDHLYPDVELTVDVANLTDTGYNNYQIHDKVYIKIPDYDGLLTAKVVETSKEPNNPSKNSIKLNNYSINTVQIIQNETIINAENKSFEFPNTELLTVTLENRDYDEDDTYSVQYPSNKLLSFTINEIQNNNAEWTGETYTRTTDENGQATIVMDYDPGDYEIEIRFGGDEEYLETSMTVKVNVGGKKEETTTTTSEGTVTQTTYYDKYGRSPDKSKILAIGRISAGRDTGSYANFYETEFKNKCPHCGKSTLFWGIFWAGNEHSNYGKFPATGRSEGGSAEGHIFCSNCDADYSCQGNEHVSNGKKLSVTKKTALSSKAKAYELRNGKRVYATTVTSQGTKNVTNTTERKVVGSVDAYVKKQALNIVGNKTGQAAAQAIASWMDKNISYSLYYNFVYSAKNCLQNKRANCCDGTRLYFEMCDAAGCTEFYKMEYIHVSGHVYGRLTSKSTGTSVYVDNASSHAAWGYICVDYRNRSVIRRTTYPTRPF